MLSSRKLSARSIRLTQSVYKIKLNNPEALFSPETISLFPNENISNIINKKQNVNTIINDAQLIFETRFTLVSTLLGIINSKTITQAHMNFISVVVLRSCCGLLFWDFNAIGPHYVLVFLRAFSLSIPFLDLSIVEEYFGLLIEKIYKLEDIPLIIQYLPAINEVMSKYPNITSNYIQLHFETVHNLCKQLKIDSVPFDQANISIFFQNLAKCMNSTTQDVDRTKIISEILEISKKPTPSYLLVSYLSLLLSLHFHTVDTIPLLEKISNGFITSNFEFNQINIQNPNDSDSKQLDLDQCYSFFSSATNRLPRIPNLNEIPEEISGSSVSAATEISDHFNNNCTLKEFVHFATIMLKTINFNIQAILCICTLISGSTLRQTLSESFAKMGAWSIILNENTFDPLISYFDDPSLRLINLRQSIFDVLSFLCTSTEVVLSIRKSFTKFISRIVKNSKFASEVVLMSYPQLLPVYNIDIPINTENENDLLVYLLEIVLIQQHDFFHRKEKVESYRFPTLYVILSILNNETCLKIISNSYYACEVIFALMFERPLIPQIRPIINQLFKFVGSPNANFVPFTKAVHTFFSVIINKPDRSDLLLTLVKMILLTPSPIILNSELIFDLFDSIMSCKSDLIQEREEILHSSLLILSKVKDFSDFDQSIVPFKKIAKVCKMIGTKQGNKLFEILYNMCIVNDIIVFPEALPMLMLSLNDDESHRFMVLKLTELCRNHICNRFSCLVGSIPSIIFKKKFYENFELFTLISLTTSNPKALRAFNQCLEMDEDLEEALLVLSSIIDRSSVFPLRPCIQFTTVGSCIQFPSINSSILQNGFIVNSIIQIEFEESHRNFFVLKGGGQVITVSFEKQSLIYKFESNNQNEKMQFNVDANYPLKRWFDLSIMLKPNEGFTVSLDGNVVAGLSLPINNFKENTNYSLIFFSSTAVFCLPIQMYMISLYASFKPNDLGVDQNNSCEMSHCVYQYSAKDVLHRSLVNLGEKEEKANFAGTSLQFATTFMTSFEVTQSINLILTLFRKIDFSEKLLDTLLPIIFNIIHKSPVVSNQMVKSRGWAIISYFLEKSSPNELSLSRWNFFIDQIAKIKSEELLRHFMKYIFYNFEIWSHAPINIQIQVVCDWQRIGLFFEDFMTVPFLLNTFSTFCSIHENLQITQKIARNKQQSFIQIDPFSKKVNDHQMPKEKGLITLSSTSSAKLPINKPKQQSMSLNETDSPLKESAGESTFGAKLFIEEDNLIDSDDDVEIEIEGTYNRFEITNNRIKTPTRQPPRQRINRSNSIENMIQIKQTYVLRSNSISSLSHQKAIEEKMKNIRQILVSLIKSVISIQKINSKDAQFLFQAIHKAPEVEQALELLDIVSYIIDSGFHASTFDIPNEWIMLFLFRSEDVRIRWMTLFSKMYPHPSDTLTQSILLLLIIQSQNILNDSTSSKNSLLAETLRICLNTKDALDLKHLIDTPITFSKGKIEYFHFAIVISIAAPKKLSDLFTSIILQLTKDKEWCEKIAGSSSPLSIFLLIYWVLKRSDINEQEEEKDYYIIEKDFVQKPFRIDEIDQNAVKILVSIVSLNITLFKTAIGVIDSISSITKSNLSKFRSFFLNQVFLVISKRSQRKSEFAQIIAESLFFHYTTFDFPKLKKLFRVFSDSALKTKKIYDSEIPDLITLLNLYLSESDDRPLSYFSLELDENGQWNDRLLAQSLIFFISALKDEKLRPVLSMLIYSYCRSQSQGDITSLTPLIIHLLNKKDNYSYLIVRAVLQTTNQRDLPFKNINSRERRKTSVLIQPDMTSFRNRRRFSDINSQYHSEHASATASQSESEIIKYEEEVMASIQLNQSRYSTLPRQSTNSPSQFTNSPNPNTPFESPNSFDQLNDSPKSNSSISFDTPIKPKSIDQLNPPKPNISFDTSIKPSSIDNLNNSNLMFKNDMNQFNSVNSKSIPKQSSFKLMMDNENELIPFPASPQFIHNQTGTMAPMSSPTNSMRNSRALPRMPNPIGGNATNPFSENLPKVVTNFTTTPKFYEICYLTMTQFCERAPRTMADSYKQLKEIFKGIGPLLNKMQTTGTSIHLATRHLGKRSWKQLCHQMFTRNQIHFKRSSFVDKSNRPNIMKRNFGFDSKSGLNRIQKESDPDIENCIDSQEPLFEAQCTRIKVDKNINGTFYIIDTSTHRKSCDNDQSSRKASESESHIRKEYSDFDKNKILRFIPGNGKIIEIKVSDIIRMYPMFVLQRQTAIEIITKQHNSFLFNFRSNQDVRTFMMLMPFDFPDRDFLTTLTDNWTKRLISNFEYLTWLNILSGRTFNYAYAYPIFPWILSDYTSPQLNLDNHKIYRDLSKPLGALNPVRLEKLKTLRDDNVEDDDNMFLYRSTYSCAFHVYHYLVRMEPFTSLHISLQDGKFDAAPRLFSSIANSYDRVTGTSFTFRELIPEFFFCSDFLKNGDKFAFGGGIDNVNLPNWSKSPIDFIYKHRRALESDYVSAHINEWIDLIWGYKQTGQSAIDADNIFDNRLYPSVWQQYSVYSSNFSSFNSISSAALINPTGILINSNASNSVMNNMPSSYSPGELATNSSLTENAPENSLYINNESKTGTKILDSATKQQIEDLLSHVGQIPQQLFDGPHPKRQLSHHSNVMMNANLNSISSSNSAAGEFSIVSNTSQAENFDSSKYSHYMVNSPILHTSAYLQLDKHSKNQKKAASHFTTIDEDNMGAESFVPQIPLTSHSYSVELASSSQLPSFYPPSVNRFQFTSQSVLISHNNAIKCVNDKQITFHEDGRIFNVKAVISKKKFPNLAHFIELSQSSFAAICRSTNEIVRIEFNKNSNQNSMNSPNSSSSISIVNHRKSSFHVSQITSLCKVGLSLFAGDADGIISNEETETVLVLNRKPISCMAGSKDFRIVVSVSIDNLVVVSSSDDLEFIRSFRIEKSLGLVSMVAICEGFGIINFLINENEFSSKILAYSVNGEFIGAITLKTQITQMITATSPSNDLDYLILADNQNKVYIINAFELDNLKEIVKMENKITALNFVRQPSMQLMIGTENGTLRFGNLNL